MELEKKLSLKKPVFYSALGHFLLLLLILFVPKLEILKPKVTVVWVDLPKGASEEVEIKMKEAEALPKTTIQEQKEWQKEEEPPKKEEKPLVTPPEKPKKPELRPIQPEPVPKKKPQPSKLTAVEKALQALNKKRPAPPEAAQVKEKGEGFKYGTGTEGLRIPPSDPEYVAYVAKVRAKIIQEWILPQTYLEGPLKPKASIVVEISKEGNIISTEWEEPSGNPSFDTSCLRAIQRAAPLPVPTTRLEWEAYNEGFLITFDPSLKAP